MCLRGFLTIFKNYSTPWTFYIQHLYSMRFGDVSDFLADNKMAIAIAGKDSLLPIISQIESSTKLQL